MTTSGRRGDEVGEHRSGFACLAGRPNAGKSTLTNALVGEKVSITSSRPQTTRHAVRGIVSRPNAQLVLVDTPGLHKPKTLLGERLNEIVRTTWASVDVVALCVACDEPVGPGDRYLVAEIARLTRDPRIAVATKTDRVSRDVIARQLAAVAGLAGDHGFEWDEVVPVSAVTGENVELVADLLAAHLPAGPLLYPDGKPTDEPESILVAELIREAALEGVRDELPHSIAVVVDEMGLRDGRPASRPLLDIHAHLFVERDSQRSIVIGRGGARLKAVGSDARAQIEAILGTPVYLDLRVKVAKDWQRDPKQLRRLGF